MTQADIFVYMEGYSDSDKYWEAEGYGDSPLPFGAEDTSAVMIDTSNLAGQALAQGAGTDGTALQMFTDMFTYQVGAALACPSVREGAWVRNGPVEFFLCPEGEVEACVAREDLEEAACAFPTEPEFDIFDPQPVVEFPRLVVTSPSDVPVLLEAQTPTYLQSPVAGLDLSFQIEVTEDSVLYTRGQRLVSAISATNIPADLPVPIGNGHCPEDIIQRFDVGQEWDPGTYTVTVSLDEDPDGIPNSGDELEIDDLGTDNLLWLYYSSVSTWSAP